MHARDVIPLCDSLAHPTLTGRWLGSEHDAAIETLVRRLDDNKFLGACAVGIAGVENYDHARFAAMCRPYRQLIPIAGVDPRSVRDPYEELLALRALGFRGIKLHPRRSSFTLDDPRFAATLAAAAAAELPVFLCTYFHGPLATYPSADPLYELVNALRAAPDVSLVLVHGGDVDLMRYAQFARHIPTLLLDVSFTLMKYAGSSLDADLRYVFAGLNRRVCIGVDHPEYGHAEVRRRFDELTTHLDDDARRNVAYRNLLRYLDVDSARFDAA